MVMIELKDICKSFGDHVVLKNFSLKINKNEFIAIIGESGAGIVNKSKALIFRTTGATCILRICPGLGSWSSGF